ncbi:hypothetical protein EJMOOK_09870 [Rhodanobacter sp. Root179]
MQKTADGGSIMLRNERGAGTAGAGNPAGLPSGSDRHQGMRKSRMESAGAQGTRISASTWAMKWPIRMDAVLVRKMPS